MQRKVTNKDPSCCDYCSEPLYINNEDDVAINERTENLRWLCCGKGIHAACWKKDLAKLQGSDRCPLCNAHTASFKKNSKMIKSLKKWVKKKKTWAVTDLAMMIFHGNGVPKNETKAIKMLEKAIAKGDANAMALLGDIFFAKYICDQQLEPEQIHQTVEMSTRAASLNHPFALLTLGDLYSFGFGVECCLDKAIQYTSRAVGLHNRSAIENLKELKLKQEEEHKRLIAAATIRVPADCKTLN